MNNNNFNKQEAELLELFKLLSSKSKVQLIEAAKALVKAEQQLQKTRH